VLVFDASRNARLSVRGRPAPSKVRKPPVRGVIKSGIPHQFGFR
jgi:hypothetical protein